MKGIDVSSITVFLFCPGGRIIDQNLPISIESGYGFLEVRVQGQTEGIFTGDP